MSANGVDTSRKEAEAARTAFLQACVAAPSEADLDAVARRFARAVAEAEPANARKVWMERFQAHVDGGVPKTVHLPPDVSVEKIVELIQSARALGCKGVAFWRSTGPARARCIRCAL